MKPLMVASSSADKPCANVAVGRPISHLWADIRNRNVKSDGVTILCNPTKKGTVKAL